MLDTDANGTIEFSEFKAAMLRTTIYLQADHLRKAFKYFDRDNSGFITPEELTSVFHSHSDLFNMF